MRVVVVNKSEDVPKEPVDGKPTHVYWNILGLTQGIRLSLAQAGVDFVDVRIDAGQYPSDTYGQAWHEAKPGLADVLYFPNLPYYLDDTVSLTQSDAILRHIGRKHDLMGAPGKEHVVDQALDELKDVISQIARPSYALGPDAVAAWYDSTAPGILKKWRKLLNDGGGDFITGDRPCVADFKLYAVFYTLTVLQDKLGAPATKAAIADDWIVSFMNRVEQLPKIKEYMSSPHFMTRPLNNPSAKFNN